MSASIIILKEMENFSYKKVLNDIQQAARDAGIHCIHVNTYFENNNEFKDLDGTLSEVDAETLQTNSNNRIYTKQCTFNIRKPTDISEDSFTWLVNKKNYFWAFDLQNIDGEYEFAFKLLSHYFKNNVNDYLWFDDAEWYYSAEDIIWLSNQPYNPEWTFKKLSEQNGQT